MNINISISQILTIAFNLWRGTLRSKGIISLIACFFIALIAAHILSSTAAADSQRIIQTMGMFSFGIFGVICNIYLGSSFIQEISQNKLHLIFTRPVSRSVFLNGKFAGMCLVLSTIFIPMTCIWMILLKTNHIVINQYHMITIFFMFAEWLIITSSSLFFAVFTTPILHAMFVFSISFFGHFSKDLVIYSSQNINLILQKSLLFLYYTIPNLELLNFKSSMLYQDKINPGDILSALFLTASWSLVFVIGACIIFSKRKLCIKN